MSDIRKGGENPQPLRHRPPPVLVPRAETTAERLMRLAAEEDKSDRIRRRIVSIACEIEAGLPRVDATTPPGTVAIPIRLAAKLITAVTEIPR